jgi:hypothetical protein
MTLTGNWDTLWWKRCGFSAILFFYVKQDKGLDFAILDSSTEPAKLVVSQQEPANHRWVI